MKFEREPTRIEELKASIIDQDSEISVQRIASDVTAQLQQIKPYGDLVFEISDYPTLDEIAAAFTTLSIQLSNNLSLIFDPVFCENFRRVLEAEFQPETEFNELAIKNHMLELATLIRQISYSCIYKLWNDLYNKNRDEFELLKNIKTHEYAAFLGHNVQIGLSAHLMQTQLARWFESSLSTYNDSDNLINKIQQSLVLQTFIYPNASTSLSNLMIRGLNTSIEVIWGLFDVIIQLLVEDNSLEFNFSNFEKLASNKDFVLTLMTLSDLDLKLFSSAQSILKENKSQYQYKHENFFIDQTNGQLRLEIKDNACERIKMAWLISSDVSQDFQRYIKESATKSKIGCPGKRLIIPLHKAALEVAKNNIFGQE